MSGAGVEGAVVAKVGPLEAFAAMGTKIGSSLDDIKDTLDRLNKRLEFVTPVDYGPAQAGVAPASGTLLLNLGSPDRGTYWEVMGLVAGGTDWNVAAAGKCGFYVTAAPNIDPSLTDLAWGFASLPACENFGTRQIVVNEAEWLIAVFTGATAAQTYVANASCTTYSIRAAQKDVTVS